MRRDDRLTLGAWLVGVVVLVWTMLTLGCASVTTGPPDDAYLHRDTRYSEWWGEMIEAVGVDEWKHLRTPDTYLMPGVGWVTLDDGTDFFVTGFDCIGTDQVSYCYGQMIDGVIYVAAPLRGSTLEHTWKHEALHLLLPGGLDPQHCDPLWYTLEVDGVVLGSNVSCGSVGRGEHQW